MSKSCVSRLFQRLNTNVSNLDFELRARPDRLASKLVKRWNELGLRLNGLVLYLDQSKLK